MFILKYKHIARAWQSGNLEWPTAPHEILPTLWGGSDFSPELLTDNKASPDLRDDSTARGQRSGLVPRLTATRSKLMGGDGLVFPANPFLQDNGEWETPEHRHPAFAEQLPCPCRMWQGISGVRCVSKTNTRLCIKDYSCIPQCHDTLNGAMYAFRGGGGLRSAESLPPRSPEYALVPGPLQHKFKHLCIVVKFFPHRPANILDRTIVLPLYIKDIQFFIHISEIQKTIIKVLA